MKRRPILFLFSIFFMIPMTAAAIPRELSELEETRYRNDNFCKFLINYELATASFARLKNPELAAKVQTLEFMKTQVCKLHYWEEPQLVQACDEGNYGCFTLSHEQPSLVQRVQRELEQCLPKGCPYAPEKAFDYFYGLKNSALQNCIYLHLQEWLDVSLIQSKVATVKEMTPSFKGTFPYFIFMSGYCAVIGLLSNDDNARCYQWLINSAIGSLEKQLAVAKSFHQMCDRI